MIGCRLTLSPPSVALSRDVCVHYVLRASRDIPFLPLGALMAQVNWVVAGRYVYQFADGSRHDVGEGSLIGAMYGAVGVEMAAGSVVAGTGLLPAAWPRLTRVPASDLSDAGVQLAPLRDPLWSPAFLPPDSSDAAIMARADALMVRLLASTATTHDRRVAIIDAWAGGGDGDVNRLAARLEVSPRQVSRLTNAIYGANAKLLAIKYRTLLTAARMVTTPGIGWDEAGGDRFADQSHFIREFRRFVGLTPGAFNSDAGRVVAEAFGGAWQGEWDHPLALRR